MGYEDGFYKKENILGYTGKIGDDPTVYFALISGKTQLVRGLQQLLTKFGHITQYHDEEMNIGREPVRECFSYAIYNDGLYSRETVYGLQEWDKAVPHKAGRNRPNYIRDNQHNVIHTSRSRFKPVTKGNIELLVLAIKQHQELKSRYT